MNVTSNNHQPGEHMILNAQQGTVYRTQVKEMKAKQLVTVEGGKIGIMK